MTPEVKIFILQVIVSCIALILLHIARVQSDKLYKRKCHLNNEIEKAHRKVEEMRNQYKVKKV